jgi:N-acetylmuramoyl-L-alanine amidase
MISIHADALEEGSATGAQIYTLAPEASSRASELLAERHRRDDLLSGVDLSQQDDAVATALMEIARRETAPRAEALAGAIVDAFRARGVRLHKSPREQGAFSVLKAPDMPAVLLELGFMSSPGDLARLTDPTWRVTTAEALAAGIEGWRSRDATLRALRRH